MDLIVLMVLARILTPSDFGIIAMARTALFIIEAITELPISSALIREEKVTDSMLDTALTLGLLRGAVITIVMAVIAFPVAGFYHEPRLIPLMLAISFAPFFRGIQSPKNIINFRQMDFNKQIIQEASGKFIALVLSIAYAIIFKDYWALVIVTVSAPLFAAIASYIMSPMPYKPTLKDWHIYKDIMGWNFLSQLMASLNWQLERLVLPKFISQDTFGKYTTFTELIAIPIQAVLVPISTPLGVKFQQAKLNNNLEYEYRSATGVIVILLAPIFAYAAIFPMPIIQIFLGDKWLSQSYIFSFLAINALIYLPTTTITPLANILFQNKALTYRTFLEFAFNLPITILFTYLWGLNGAILARIISTSVVLLVTIDMGKKLVNYNWINYFKDLSRLIVSLSISGIITYSIFHTIVNNSTFLSTIIFLIVSFCIFIALFLLILFSIWKISGKSGLGEKTILNFTTNTFIKFYKKSKAN